MSKQRKMILIAAAVGVIAMFLPWWSIDMGFVRGSVSGMHGEGIVVFLCFAGAAALAAMGEQTRNLSQQNWTITLIVGALAILITLISFFNAPPLGDRGFGLYIALIAAVCIIAFAYINRTAGETLQSGFDALKHSFGGHSTAAGTTTTTRAGSSTKVINPANDPANPTV